MRTMLVLIKREIIDHHTYFAAAIVVTGLMTALTIAIAAAADSISDIEPLYVALVCVGIVAILGAASLGSSQMHTDRSRNISAFLMALPVTRAQLFIARILAGVLILLVLLVPFTVAAVVTVDIGLAELPFQHGRIGGMFWASFLACLACYSIGLYSGWSRRSLAPTLGLLPIVFLAATLVVIKGFGLEAIVILSVLTVACLTASWCRFSSSSL